MNAALGLYHIAHLAYRQTKGGILKRLLHLTASKGTEVTTMRVRRAITVCGGQLCELGCELVARQRVELILERLQDGQGFLLCASNVALSEVSAWYNSIV